MRLILARHYKTVNNEQRRIMGWGDAPPAADWETDLLYVDQQIRQSIDRLDAVYSSALMRSYKSARYLAQKQGLSRVQAIEQLNEVNYGELRDQSKEQVELDYPQYKNEATFVFPGGESFLQMQRRSVDFIRTLENTHAQASILVVAHAGVIRGLISHFLSLPFSEHLRRKVSHRYVGDFLIQNDHCLCYNELGKPSGFVKDTAVKIPCHRPAPEPAAATMLGHSVLPPLGYHFVPQRPHVTGASLSSSPQMLSA